MIHDIRSNKTFETLRKMAEEIIDAREIQLPYAEELDFLRLVHEVEVQHVELELQNEELRYATKELENSRNEFAELYHSAPVTYVTLNEKGIIVQANAAAARMFAGNSNFIVGRSFSTLIVPEDRDLYFSYLKRFALGAAPTSCGLRVLHRDDEALHVQMQATPKRDPRGRRRRA